MDFQGRYQILEKLCDGEAKTFRALQKSSGRAVLLHQLWEERTPPNQHNISSLLFTFLRVATDEQMKCLIDMGEEASRVFVVTEDTPACQDLRQWLEATTGRLASAGKPRVSEPAPSGDSGAPRSLGDIGSRGKQEHSVTPDGTQLFTRPEVIAGQRPLTRAQEPSSAPATPPQASVEPTTPSRPEEFAPGLAGASKAEVSRPPQPPVASPSVAQGEAAGEFTQLFYGRDKPEVQRPPSMPVLEKTSAPPTPPVQPSSSEGPGEFTRLFQVPQELKPARSEPAREPSFQPPAPSGTSDSPGEFTRMFRPGALPSQPAAPLPAGPPKPVVPLPASSGQKGPGQFTQLFQAYQAPKSEPALDAIEQAPVVSTPPSPAAPETGPGEFTMLFQRPPQATAPPPPVAPPSTVAQTPPAAAQSAEPDEFARLFEVPKETAGAPSQGAPQSAPSATPQAPTGGGVPVTPMAAVPTPLVPSVPYPQPPIISPPVAPQPYPLTPPQFQPPAAPSAFAMPPQPAIPSIQPVAVPAPITPQAAPPTSAKSKLLVPLILGGLFVIAVALVLFFALKH